MAYLEKFGRPILPFQRLRRELYDYKRQSHLEHLENQGKYLQIAPYLAPSDTFTHPTIRHPDLQPSNIFISNDLEIIGIIDWQHCTVLPLFMQCGIPRSFQNYGDSVSESLSFPSLPSDLDNMSDREQFEHAEIYRRRQLHYFYVKGTAELNQTHYNALTHDFSILRQKLCQHASDPWEGDIMTMKADLIYLTKDWSKIARADPTANGDAAPSCPIAFSEEEISTCLRLSSAQVEADKQMGSCRDAIGVGPEGWVPSDLYEEAKQREKILKADSLEGAESDEEREKICEHWIFDDFDEEEYT